MIKVFIFCIIYVSEFVTEVSIHWLSICPLQTHALPFHLGTLLHGKINIYDGASQRNESLDPTLTNTRPAQGMQYDSFQGCTLKTVLSLIRLPRNPCAPDLGNRDSIDPHSMFNVYNGLLQYVYKLSEAFQETPKCKKLHFLKS